MDVTSYLLGKNAGGGGGGSDLDWSALGYSGTPQPIVDDYNYAKNIYDNWDATQTNLLSKFYQDKALEICPLVNTENATNMQEMFSGCYYLKSVPLLNTTNATNMSGMFYSCNLIKTIPQFDTSKNKNFSQTFYGCGKLENVPIFNVSNITGSNAFQNMFYDCGSLTDKSLDNILQMCINATGYTGTKTLYKLGIRSGYYAVSRIQSLSNYQNFINAGWTIGY